MLFALHRSLVKPLEPSSCAAALLGPNALMPAAARSSTMPAQSGASGPTTTSAMSLRAAECDHRRMVGRIERDQFAFLRDAGIARRAVELVDQRARRDLPGQRMLAAAGTEQENVHRPRIAL